jgi:hypothetical protein
MQRERSTQSFRWRDQPVAGMICGLRWRFPVARQAPHRRPRSRGRSARDRACLASPANKFRSAIRLIQAFHALDGGRRQRIVNRGLTSRHRSPQEVVPRGSFREVLAGEAMNDSTFAKRSRSGVSRRRSIRVRSRYFTRFAATTVACPAVKALQPRARPRPPSRTSPPGTRVVSGHAPGRPIVPRIPVEVRIHHSNTFAVL